MRIITATYLSMRYPVTSFYQQDIIPSAKASYNQLKKGYDLGAFSFLDLLDAQRTLNRVESEYLDNMLTKITLPGSIGLAIAAIIPYVLVKFFKISFEYASFFGGTGLLIIVGVGMDTVQQIESHLSMRHYDGFVKKAKIRGRRQ